MKWFAAVGVLFPNPADGFASEPTRAKKSRFIFSVYMEYTYEIWAILLLDDRLLFGNRKAPRRGASPWG
jgi:hypothetical protein